ncbi:MAG: TIGR03915 family putative DNA repair protein [Oscillospiraceae bacterium]|nr:TIGR03915 family putative DNA repair protein [Oscillospiraceae bacterium]
MSLILLHDGSFEGLLTAVFDSYAHSPPPVSVAAAEACQQRLDCQYAEVAADPAKSARVIAGIKQKMGPGGYQKVWQAFLFDEDSDNNRSICRADKSDVTYHYIRLGMRVGGKIFSMLTDARVMAMDRICALVGREAGLTNEFLRFSELEGGVYYSEIEPEHAILPMLMPHFVDRLNIQPFIIHDLRHGFAGVYDLRDWYLTSTAEMTLPAYSNEEQRCRRMWKLFYDTIAIKERTNPVCRRNHMPKKYWKHMVEMQPEVQTANGKLQMAICRSQQPPEME